MLVDTLLDVLNKEGVNIEDSSFKSELGDCIAKNNFRFIHNKNGKEIGFYSWLEVKKDNKLNIYINSMLILKEHNHEYDLLKIRDTLRKLYPQVNLIYWARDKKKVEGGKYERFYYTH